MKAKIGTILDEEILKKLKEYSARENRSISEIIQDALTNFFRGNSKSKELRLQAVEQLCSKPFKLTVEELREILEEDFYNQ